MSREYKIIQIKDEGSRFLVEIEFTDTAERKKFGYPKGNGWETMVNHEPKFLSDIKTRVGQMEALKTDKSTISKLKKDFEGKTIKSE